MLDLLDYRRGIPPVPSRPVKKWRPSLESLEGKRLPSAGVASSVIAGPAVSAEATAKKPTTGYLVYRITNPNQYNNHLTPPFGHVMVQTNQPVPGQTYNVLDVAVRNGTAQTFGTRAARSSSACPMTRTTTRSSRVPSSGSRGRIISSTS